MKTERNRVHSNRPARLLSTRPMGPRTSRLAATDPDTQEVRSRGWRGRASMERLPRRRRSSHGGNRRSLRCSDASGTATSIRESVSRHSEAGAGDVPNRGHRRVRERVRRHRGALPAGSRRAINRITTISFGTTKMSTSDEPGPMRLATSEMRLQTRRSCCRDSSVRIFLHQNL